MCAFFFFSPADLITANSLQILASWRERVAEDAEFGDVAVVDTGLVDALARTIRTPQVTAEGAERDWTVAVADYLRAQSARIGIISRQFLHLHDTVLSLITESNIVEEEKFEAAERVARALYWAFEMAARDLVRSLDHDANHDELTGLQNRRAFHSLVEKAQRAGATSLTVAAIDMDGLKTINDRDGHEAGDNAIKALAVALSSITRPGVEAFRFGGDEFFVLALEDGPDHITLLLEKAREESPQKFSFGAASWPDDGNEFADVKRAADTRMYAEKLERKKGGADIRG